MADKQRPMENLEITKIIEPQINTDVHRFRKLYPCQSVFIRGSKGVPA